jgi:oxalate decarboxylase/phosphoglucose isomerase-like protein (cupin superfamily)
MGVMYGEPDHAPFEWEQGAWDEVLYVLKGNVRVAVKDHADKEAVLEGKEGDTFYLTAGFFYAMQATGVETEVMWISAPAPKVGVALWGETEITEGPEYAKKLRALRNR